MSVTYNGLIFETSLLAQWAAFFDLVGWEWSVGVAPVENWKPDFRVAFGCGHSECNGRHTILVSVLPINDLNQIQGHPALNHRYRVESLAGEHLADAGAIFGSSPKCSEWEMSHGAGSGIESVSNWVDNADALWEKAKSSISDAPKA